MDTAQDRKRPHDETDSVEPAAARPAKRGNLAASLVMFTLAAFKRLADTSLPPHTDFHDHKFGGAPELRGGLIQSQLVLTDSSDKGAAGFVCVDARESGDYVIPAFDYKPLDDASVAKYGPHARMVRAKPGSVIMWLGSTIHSNCKAGHRLKRHKVSELTHIFFKDATREKIVTALTTAGYCVILEVINQATIDRYIAGMTEDILKARQVDGASPKGQAGCAIWKNLRLPCTLNAQERRLDAAVRALFAMVYGTNELTVSADSFAAQYTQVGPKYVISPETVRRAVQFICWAPSDQLDQKTAKAKLKSFEKGRSACHNPLMLTSTMGGRHMSDRHHEWDVVPFEGTTPEMRKALMGPWA